MQKGEIDLASRRSPSIDYPCRNVCIPCFIANADVVLYGPDIAIVAEAFALQDHNPSGMILFPISQEELSHEKIADELRSAIRQGLNEGRRYRSF